MRRPKFKSYAELNAWLEDRCVAWAKANPHQELRDRTIWDVFQDERSSLALLRSVRRLPCRASLGLEDLSRPVRQEPLLRGRPGRWPTCRDPCLCRAARVLAGRQDRGRHARAFGRDNAIYDPLYYIPVLARKPGALRNGAPFKDWDLPSAIRRVQRKLGKVPNGDRQMVQILRIIPIDGLDAVDAACAEALNEWVIA